MFRQFITSIDYAKLIKMQANQPAPFERAVRIDKCSKAMVASKAKTKTLGRRK